MGLHITRGIAATMNLLLGSLLVWFWIYLARDDPGPLDSFGIWVLILAMVAMTISSTIAGFSLVMRRTLPSGLKWNTIAGASWFLSAVGGLFSSLADGRVRPNDALAIAVLAGGGLFWLFLGWAVQRYARIDKEKASIEAHCLAVPPVEPAVLAAPIALRSYTQAASVQEATLRHR